MRILLVQTAFVGDLFLSIPLIRSLRRQFSSSQITLLCRKNLGSPFKELQLVDEVIETNKKDLESRRQTLNLLHNQSWDLIVSPHESPRTALWVWRIKAKRKVGFRQWWNFFVYTDRVKKSYELPDALRQLRLMQVLSKDVEQKFVNQQELSQLAENLMLPIPEWASMQLSRDEKERLKSVVMSEDWFRYALNAVIIAPGSVWPTKRWSQEGYAELAKELIKTGRRVILIGTGPEKATCDWIQGQVPEVLNLAGQTSLMQTLKLMSQAQMIFCNDSGASHMAAAVGLPTLSIFGPTTLAQGFRPWNQKTIVVQRNISCRPCGRHGGLKCPIGTHECMLGISSQTVYSAAQPLLRGE